MTSFSIDLPIRCASPKHSSDLSFPALKLQCGSTDFHRLSLQLFHFPLHWPSAFSSTMPMAVIHTCSGSLSSFQVSEQLCFVRDLLAIRHLAAVLPCLNPRLVCVSQHSECSGKDALLIYSWTKNCVARWR